MLLWVVALIEPLGARQALAGGHLATARPRTMPPRKKIDFPIILKAAKDNDVRTMAACVAQDPTSVMASNVIGQTALHVAAIWGNVEVGKILIAAGADFDTQNQYGLTPLHMASQSDKLEFAKLLLDAGADMNLQSSNGLKPFEAAKSDAMRVLCGAPALLGHAAVRTSSVEALEDFLCQSNIDVSDQDSDGNTILHLAVQAALGDIIGDEPLIEEPGAPASGAPPQSSAVLDLVLKHDSVKGFANAMRLHNDAGFMPLHVAADRGNEAVCSKLLQVPAVQRTISAVSLKKDEQHNGQWGKKNAAGKIERLSSANATALHLAVQFLHDLAEEAEDEEEEVIVDSGLVKLLLKHGADPNAADIEMQTPIHIAIMGGLHEVVALLCEAKADLSLGCKPFGKNNTALHQAVLLRDVPMLKLLAEHGAGVDVPGRDGWTPLGMAVRSNAVEVVKALIDAKASVQATAGNGKTPLELATINNKPGIIELLNVNGVRAMQLD